MIDSADLDIWLSTKFLLNSSSVGQAQVTKNTKHYQLFLSFQCFYTRKWPNLQFKRLNITQDVWNLSMRGWWLLFSNAAKLCMKSKTFITLSSPKTSKVLCRWAPWECALLTGTLIASYWGGKEQDLFCNSPDEKLKWQPPGCLFAYLTSRRLPAH